LKPQTISKSFLFIDFYLEIAAKDPFMSTKEINLETDTRLPSGEWNGFYVESHQPRRGWMNLYMSFANGIIEGEGTDYVGPWVATGDYDLQTGICSWVKQYLGKHRVVYSGRISENGIQGQWEISYITGEFHIWPKGMNHFNERYLKEELDVPGPPKYLDPFEIEQPETETAIA
jgi:hypothetical protein